MSPAEKTPILDATPTPPAGAKERKPPPAEASIGGEKASTSAPDASSIVPPTPPAESIQLPPPLPSAVSEGGIQVGPSDRSIININQSKEILYGDALLRVASFSWEDDRQEIDRLDEIQNSEHFIYDDQFVTDALATLSRHRFLLLTGDADCGKVSMACYIASRLRADGAIPHNTLVYGPPGRDVRLHLPSVLEREKNLHGRIVIFRDALEYKNPYLSAFLISMKGTSLAHLTHELERIQSYLILTNVSGSLPTECSAGMPEWLRPSLPKLTPELLLRGVSERIALLFAHSPDRAYTLESVPEELKVEIAERCQTISRAGNFIDSWLPTILRGDKSVEEAFKEFDSLSSWFQRSNHENLEAWTYCLAAVLSDPLNYKEGVPWADFNTIYRAIRRHLLRHRGRSANEPVFDEPALHAIAGIEIKRIRPYPGDIVAFKDPSSVERHWRTLLTRFRSLLTGLIPVFEGLTDHESAFVRARAAQTLGRIGYLDAQGLATTWLESWSRSESWRKRSLVGYLAQGALNAGDPAYRTFVLDSVDLYSRQRERTWAAIAAFKQIGVIDPSLGMGKLKAIAKSKLAPAFDVTLEIKKQLDRKLSADGVLPAELVILLDDFYMEVLKNAELAHTFKYALVSLSMTIGITTVLGHLRRWALGSPSMGALVCFVFLQKEGIADELTLRKQPLFSQQENEDQGEDSSCNMVVGSLIDAPDGVEALATFLETLYASLPGFFPPDSAAPLKHLLFDYCKKWVGEALPLAPCRAAMIELIGRLLQAPLQELREHTYDWLASPDFSQPDMAAFAKDARLFKKPGH